MRGNLLVNKLWIRDIKGIFNEMYEPSSTSDFYSDLEIDNHDCLNASNYFWAKHFQKERIEYVIDTMCQNLYVDKYSRPQYKAIAANRELFIANVMEIPEKLSARDTSPLHFFNALETLNILCSLYSDFMYAPFKLSLQEGFVLDNNSSQDIYENCMNPCQNPYLTFVLKEIIPLIKKHSPDILFLQGPPSYYLMAIAIQAKIEFPSIHICITRHDSEYYSMNKIVPLLIDNHPLFRMVDSIILEYYEYGELLLTKALEYHIPLSSVPNLIYKNDMGTICETYYEFPTGNDNMKIGFPRSNRCIDIHIEPYIPCYWNKCTFCGINKKYHHKHREINEDALNHKIAQINQLSKTFPDIWFIDEAIHPDELQMIAQKLVQAEIHIIWQVRCRADKKLLEDDLPEILSQSGLRELRIGLESASYHVLKKMNKFDDDFDLSLIENIIKKYTAYGISVHCPMIIGFPGETRNERQRTYAFLGKMAELYPLFSFNINILNIDIKSDLFRNWGEYNLTQLKFPCQPQFFLGNHVAWIQASVHDTLDNERQKFMREALFPWMPVNALTSPTTFYRLAETSRNTLLWKAGQLWNNKTIFSVEMELEMAHTIVVYRESVNRLLIYNWETHHYMHGNQNLFLVLNAFNVKRNVSSVIKQLYEKDPETFPTDQLIILIEKMFFDKYLVGTYNKHDIKNTQQLKNEYNDIYKAEKYFYKLETDQILMSYTKYLKGGQALELGIGMGKNIQYLLDLGYTITGVDISDIAISKLKQKYSSDKCRFYVEDICEFEIPANHFSLIVCSMVLSYLKDTELVLLIKKVIQGLSQGGCLYIVDLSENDPLYKISPQYTTDHRNFFNREKLQKLLEDLQIIELSDIYRKNERRVGCDGYFGLTVYFGIKK